MTQIWASRVRRLAALALLSIAMTVAWTATVYPIVTLTRSIADDRESALRALGRNRALVAQAPKVHEALGAVDRYAQSSRLYDGSRLDQVTLQMETDLRAIFKIPNTVTSMTAETPAVDGSLTRVAVKVGLSMPMDQLAQALQALQANARLLRIDGLIIQAPDFQNVDSNPVLSVQLEIAGYTRSRLLTRT